MALSAHGVPLAMAPTDQGDTLVKWGFSAGPAQSGVRSPPLLGVTTATAVVYFNSIETDQQLQAVA